MTTSSQFVTIGQYLLDRLYNVGVSHLFGSPSNNSLGLETFIERHAIELIKMTGEKTAGYAADAYARMNGTGAVYIP